MQTLIQHFPASGGGGTSPQTPPPPRACKRAIGANAPPNHPPNVEDGSTPLTKSIIIHTDDLTLAAVCITGVDGGGEYPLQYLARGMAYVIILQIS